MRKTKKISLLLLINVLVLIGCSDDDDNSNETITSVTDIDNNVYDVVKIGDQYWMAENLRVTKFNDGTDIPQVLDDTSWNNMDSAAFCWYNNEEETNGTEYGGLYNWYAVNSGKLAPNGWHIPSEEEWETLINYLGGAEEAANKLKEQGNEHWVSNSVDENVNNETGFSAFAGGSRTTNGFGYMTNYGYWWSSTAESDTEAIYRDMRYNSTQVFNDNRPKTFGFSIRCIKD